MSDEKTPKAKELIEQINVLESAEEIDAFLPEGEERTTVLEAAENRKKALSEEAASPDEETADVEEVVDDDPDPEEEEEGKLEVLAKAIEGVLAQERAIRPSNGKPGLTEGALEAAAAVLDDVDSATTEQVDALDTAIEQHLQYDAQRRGMQTPSKAMKALISAYAQMGEDEDE